MASYTYDQLKDMTVAQLREIAQGVENEELKGQATMHKEALLPLLCKALNIPMHKTVDPNVKGKLKAAIRKLRTIGSEARAKKDFKTAGLMRRHVHAVRRHLRRLAS